MDSCFRRNEVFLFLSLFLFFPFSLFPSFPLFRFFAFSLFRFPAPPSFLRRQESIPLACGCSSIGLHPMLFYLTPSAWMGGTGRSSASPTKTRKSTLSYSPIVIANHHCHCERSVAIWIFPHSCENRNPFLLAFLKSWDVIPKTSDGIRWFYQKVPFNKQEVVYSKASCVLHTALLFFFLFWVVKKGN